ncbi:exodeoxyribonuclease V subunit beta [Massilia psychrophila]|uniref:RecBCD enzyme subunit RecB n=1 Tax=Massilia psychrophila TaxID=1603353 RepID=A0A2G8T2R0_9BURK|nr:exodeoxyribonuclease V subunit beta [Massilia psychrophila]PIL40347.1 exodeoxyribonuclease V subunit beta [Massilia psychrophila]GGE77913.1 RecBCD enzyme subunit RecB [Massilia psychrophila]
MSELLQPLIFPLHGSRLIEASAGTGKTWTIAALYLRLVLGHGDGDGDEGAGTGFGRALLPCEILVMTFTRAATRELSNRVRERLVEAAACFRDMSECIDPYLTALAASYPGHAERQQAAYRLMLAAETMDEAAIFTIDAWCQRMLREHAFDSGSLFDEELVSDERALFEDAAHDYWRQNVYPLTSSALAALMACWPHVGALKQSVRELVRRIHLLGAVPDVELASLIASVERTQKAELAGLKDGWFERANQMEQWIAGQREQAPKCFNGNKLRADSLVKWFEALRAWACDPAMVMPALSDTAWHRLTPDGMLDACSKGFTAAAPASFEHTTDLWDALKAITPLSHALYSHAASSIARRIDELKKRSRQFGFADMLERLKAALEGENGAQLRARITAQYPVAMVDEFQDTSPDQYAIFNLLYRVGENDRAQGLFLIGDPKQSIYGFRGADINSYLAARASTAGRHYQLGTNYRSTTAVVAAVNQLFLHAEHGFAAGAFKFKKGDVNPLPFDAVLAHGRGERLVGVDGPFQALAVCSSERDDMGANEHREFFAHHCAEHIVALLNDPEAGFEQDGALTRLVPADIAILVRDRREAQAIRRALAQRKVLSVYLSDKDSVVDSVEAADVLRWLQAVANPLDGALARAAFATQTAGLPLAALARIASDELAWEARVEQLKALHAVWQRQGVLAMLRRFVHELNLPSTLLRQAGGERRLTNLLHLAELLQSASRGLDGEQALIRWFAEQVAGLGEGGEGGEERVLRLESDADLVKVVTVHKSKGLEYPLVYLPFAATARKTDRRNRSFFEFVDGDDKRRLDLALSDEALAAVDRARIEEDLRLLYVALTRARHFLWLGVAAVAARKAGENKLHESALGYLLGGGAAIAALDMNARWETLRGGSGAIELKALHAPGGVTMLAREQAHKPLVEAAVFGGRVERDWSVGSFTSLTRQTSAAPMHAQEETMLEEAPKQASGPTQDTPWHRFPRGPVPGNFLHEQLECLAQDGFASVHDIGFEARMKARCERAGWGHRKDDAIAWLREIAITPLPQLGAALAQLGEVLPEMEFWFPSRHLDSAALDALCTRSLLEGVARPALPERQLHGMLKGFADLVFEHEGRYWVLDYKSNALGANDAAYGRAAMAAGMAGHRYDVQGAIYMLALHRLLRSRLGIDYDPARQLGGALFLFLRGIANPSTRGCYLLEPDLALLDGLEQLLGADITGNSPNE